MKHRGLLDIILVGIIIVLSILCVQYKSDNSKLIRERDTLTLQLKIAKARISDLKDDYKFLEVMMIKHNERITQIEWALRGSFLFVFEKQGVGGDSEK
jgi:hypothetical protein